MAFVNATCQIMSGSQLLSTGESNPSVAVYVDASCLMEQASQMLGTGGIIPSGPGGQMTFTFSNLHATVIYPPPQ